MFKYLLLALAAFAIGAFLIPMLLKRPEEELTQDDLEREAEKNGKETADTFESFSGQAYSGYIGFQKGLFGVAYGDEWSDLISPLYLAEWFYGEEIY